MNTHSQNHPRRLSALLSDLRQAARSPFKHEPPTLSEFRAALAREIDYYRQAIPGTDASRKSARAIVRGLKAHPWMHDQIPHDLERMARREARGLSPVELDQ